MRDGNYVYLRIYGDFDTAGFISRIGIKPTKIIPKNTLGPLSNFPKETSLRYAQANAGSGMSVIDFYELADQVVKQLEPYESEFQEVLKEFQVKAELQFVVYLSRDEGRSTPIIGLSERAIRFISSLNASVDIDSYIG